jgi:hypothetical protein
MPLDNSIANRSIVRAFAAAFGLIAAITLLAASAQAETRLRDVSIAYGAGGYMQYKVKRGNDGVFRATEGMRIALRVRGKINNTGNAHKIFDAYFVGSASGKPVFPLPGMTPSHAYRLLRSPTKSIAAGPFTATVRPATLGNFRQAAEKRCRDRRSGDLLPLKLTMVVDAGRQAVTHRPNTYGVDRVRKVVSTTINVRIRCVASHGPKTSTRTRGSNAKPPVRGSGG